MGFVVLSRPSIVLYVQTDYPNRIWAILITVVNNNKYIFQRECSLNGKRLKKKNYISIKILL